MKNLAALVTVMQAATAQSSSAGGLDDGDGHSTEGHSHMVMVAVIRYAQIGLGVLAVCMFCALICHLCSPCVALREKWRDCLKKAEDAADAISALREARRTRCHALLAPPRPQTADLLYARGRQQIVPTDPATDAFSPPR